MSPLALVAENKNEPRSRVALDYRGPLNRPPTPLRAAYRCHCIQRRTRFPGQPPHDTIDTFNSGEDALRWCDPHRERIWEEARDADETKLLISRDYKEGTVAWRMAHLTLAELSAS